MPDVEVVWVRDSTGVITARFLAEKDNPRADMVLGLAASSLLLFEKAGLLETYKPKGADALKPAFRDGKPPDTWTGMDAFLGVICFNTVEGRQGQTSRRRRPGRTCTDPSYKGKIVMPHPASSGTGYLTVAAWLQMMGEAEAWKFMDALHQNIARLHPFGLGALRAGRQGRARRRHRLRHARRRARRPRARRSRSILPKEGVGWDMEATAIVKGTKNLDAAKKVADWAATKAANELYSKYYAIVADPDGEEHAAELSGRRRAGDGQERLRLDGREPRPHPRRVVEALRVQGGAEELSDVSRTRCARSRCARCGPHQSSRRTASGLQCRHCVLHRVRARS